MSFIVILTTLNYGHILHPVHVSVTSVEYHINTDSVSVTIKLFKDDFANLLLNKYNTPLNYEEGLSEKTREIINLYIKDQFKFAANNSEIEIPDFFNYTFDFEAIWFYYSFATGKKVKKIKIMNQLMFDMFDDQKNLLIFKTANQEDGLLLDRQNPEASFQLLP